MYEEFAHWLTSSDVFKLGEVFGFCMGILVTMFIEGFIELTFDKIQKYREKNKKHID